MGNQLTLTHRILAITVATAAVLAIGCTPEKTPSAKSGTKNPVKAGATTLEANSTPGSTPKPDAAPKAIDNATAPSDSAPSARPSAPTIPKASPKTEAKPTSSASSRPPKKPLRTVCIRACNKAQMCGKAGGSGAAECMQKCLALKDEASDSTTRILESFRAQEACADVKCEAFESCVQREIANRRQLKPVAAYEPEYALQTCTALCEHEQKCKPDLFVQLRKNMDICKKYCAAVLVGTDTASGAARTIMNEAIQCLGKSCDDFEQCVQTGR